MPSPEQTSRTDVSDIEIDSNGRHILNTPDKIVRWIKYQFEEQDQEIKYSGIPSSSKDFRHIDLRNCVLYTEEYQGVPVSMNLRDIAGKIDCIVDTSEEYEQGLTPFMQEVYLSIWYDNSLIYRGSFNRTKFHGPISLHNTSFCPYPTTETDWSFCEFMENLWVEECKFSGGDFCGSKFHGTVHFLDNDLGRNSIEFLDCHFYNNVEFDHIIFDNYESEDLFDIPGIYFDLSIFEMDFALKYITFIQYCSFNFCTFNQNAVLTNISDAKLLCFNSAIIKKGLTLTADRGQSDKNLIKDLCFDKADIAGFTNIKHSNIQNLQAHFATIQNNGIFKSLDSIITNCDMTSICNRGMLFFEDSTISKIRLADAMNLGIVELENTYIDGRNIADRKTARILKDSASKNNNAIDALKYKYLELELYRKEGGISIGDRIILIAQKVSNRYGTNFIQGIAFTMTAAMVFFWLINYTGADEPIFRLNARFDFSGFGEIWKKYLDVLNVLNFRDKLDGVGLNAWGETLFLAAKIFIAYGMYQKVSAFRKYSKSHM